MNIILCLVLIGPLGVAGISVATGLAGWIQVYLLHKKLKTRDALEFDDRLRVVFPKIAVCSCLMALVLSVLAYVLHDQFRGDMFTKILALVALIGAGSLTYALSVQISGVLKFSDIRNYVRRRKV